MPSFPDIDEPLGGPEVRLRLAAEGDIPEILIAHQDDPSLHVRLGAARPPSGAELGRQIDSGPADRSSGSSVWLTILGSGSEFCRGQIYVQDVDWDHRRAELGIWVAPARRGHGMAGAALTLAGGWLLRDCGMMRVQLLTELDNEPMVRAAVRAGFVDEGILRAYLRRRGRRVDVRVMSMIAGDLGPA